MRFGARGWAAAAVAIALAVAPPAAAAPRWSEPETIGGPTAFNPRVSLDARGTALATWTTRGRIAYSWRAPHGSWTEPRFIGPAIEQRPAHALTPLGRATLAWSDGSRISVATARRGGAFRQPEVIEVPGRVVSRVRLAVADGGDAIVAWGDAVPNSDDPDSRVLVAIRGPGGRFGEPRVVGRDAAGGVDGLAMNAAGAAVVAWMAADNAMPMASYRPPAGRFGPAERAPVADNAIAIPVAVDQDGNAFVATSTFGYVPGVPLRGTAYAVRSPLGEWDGPLPLPIGAGGRVTQVLPQPAGAVAFVVERTDDAGRDVIAVIRRLADGTMDGPHTISSPGTGSPRMATDLLGNMLGTWCHRCDAWARGTTVEVNEATAVAGFGEPRIVSPPDSIGSDAALNEAGHAVIAWSHLTRRGDFRSTVLQAVVREDASEPPLPAPPRVAVRRPRDRSLGRRGGLPVRVRCNRRCKVEAGGLLFAGGRKPAATAETRKARRLRHGRRGRVRLRFGRAARRAARHARRPWVSVSVTARGKSPRPVTASRRIRLR